MSAPPAGGPVAGAESAEALAVPATGGGANDLAIRAGQCGIGIALLLAWHFASGRLIDPFYISAPLAVASKLWTWAADGTLWLAFSYTFQAMILGFVVGSLAGFAVGFALGRSDVLARLFDPYITAIYCMPKIALAPLLILWFGIGIESKVAMAALIVFFLVFLNTFSGVRDVNPLYLQVTAIMGASPLQQLRHVVFPSAAAWVLTGLKVSVPYALIGAVVGELISSNRGIGFLIGQASGLFDTAGVFAGLAVLAVTGIVLNAGLKKLENRLLRWRGQR
ncbi:MAG: ABC transporter permease [Burkholderiales bacterium]|nr:ABC transporter permease [Burkholderiales bacterium]